MGLALYSEVYPFTTQILITHEVGTITMSVLSESRRIKRVDAVWAVSTSVAIHALVMGVNDGVGVSLPAVSVPAGAGTGAIPVFDVLAALPTLPLGALLIEPVGTLDAHVVVELAEGETIHLIIFGGEL